DAMGLARRLPGGIAGGERLRIDRDQVVVDPPARYGRGPPELEGRRIGRGGVEPGDGQRRDPRLVRLDDDAELAAAARRHQSGGSDSGDEGGSDDHRALAGSPVPGRSEPGPQSRTPSLATRG